MTMELEGLPSKPYFNCTAEGLDILDTAEMKSSARLDAVEPWMRFELGDRNSRARSRWSAKAVRST